MSSVREVLPGRDYFIPFEGDKADPLKSNEEHFTNLLKETPAAKPIGKTLYGCFTGISPILAEEIIYLAGIDSSRPSQSLSAEEFHSLWTAFERTMQKIRNREFAPNIVYENDVPVFYGPFRFQIYQGSRTEDYTSISALLCDYYAKKKTLTDMRQKTSRLRQVVQTLLNKNYKYDLQLKQLKDTEKRSFQLYGELITAFGYNISTGSASMKAETITRRGSSLDPALSPIDNGKKFENTRSSNVRRSPRTHCPDTCLNHLNQF